MSENLDEWKSLINDCAQKAQPETSPKSIDTIAIVTADRVAGMIRAATSYLENAKKFGRQVNLVVADDSKTPAARAECKKALQDISKKFDVPVFFAGLEEKQAYAAELAAASGVPRDLIDFALLDPFEVGFSPGANRNALLLHHAGLPFFCADDDTVCRLVSSTDDAESLHLSDPFRTTEIWPYESLEELEKSARFTDVDLLAAHEKCLGKDLGTIFKERPEIAADELNPGFVQDIEENRARVLVSATGLAGDCGYRTPAFLFDLKGEAYERFTRDPASYRQIVENRQIVRAAPQLTIAKGGFCQSIALAFDNREMLPPFPPVLRGEDWLFSMLLDQTNETAAMAYLPLSIMHLPLVARKHTAEDQEQAPFRRPVVGLFVGLLRMVRSSAYREGHLTLEQFGKAFKAAAADKSFDVFAEQNSQMESDMQSGRLLDLLDENPTAPDFWKEDVRRLQQAQEKAAQLEEHLAPEELVKSHGKENAVPVLQKILVRYGDLMMAWPKLFETARALRQEKGTTLAQKL